MSKEPELGQMMFGNPTGNYGTKTYQDAFIYYLLDEIEKVYWNKYQVEWNRHYDPKFKGMEFRPYYWDEENPEAKKPNLKFDFSKQEIRWYKHPGRGQSCTLNWKAKMWTWWFNNALKVIRENDSEL